jgi:outer membrane receptor for ferrienterochelin and colicins
MKNFQTAVVVILLLISSFAFGQGKVKITGKVIEQDTKQPLEFANVTILTPTNTIAGGGLTDVNGEYNIDVPPGTYNIKYDFISFKPQVISNREISTSTNLGVIALAPDATLIEEVAITAERTTVDIKLDKRVYSIGNDMMVKGGTVSDVLDNVPSLSVDSEGNVALRGNQSVTILIDGRPSTLAGSNVAEVLRLLPADSVDKVEVITNPSARYDAEGGGGIVNIILKKGKADGFNGSVTANTGTPDNHGFMANLNLRSTNFNLFSNIGYNYRQNPGESFTNSRYLDRVTNETSSYTDETRENERLRKGYNASFGMEWFLTKSLTWTNSVNFRRNTGGNVTDTYYENYNADRVFLNKLWRYNDEDSEDNNVQFSSSVTQKFNNDGHELRVDASVSKNMDDERAVINNTTIAGISSSADTFERTINDDVEDRALLQADYVLPLGEKSRFEAGYRGSFSTLENDARAERLDPVSNTWVNNENYSNYLQYKEKVNALYAQYGSKINKFSYLLGLRWEDSNIDVNLLNTGDFNNKRYNNFFPSAFLTYEFSENSNVSLSYSRRINRPRGRFLNPFAGLESNINVFRGNPDLDPSMTNAFDLGYYKRFGKLTLNTSAYLNITDDSFQFVRQIQGETPEGTPITLTTPVNLAKEYRFGLEFNVNYNPFRWWRINGNLNFFRNETQGDYFFQFTDPDTGEVFDSYQNFDRTAYAWTVRANSKITLPWNIDWQLNGNFDAPQNTPQGKRRAVAAANTAISKDFLKDKATIALNVQDIFNSRKMKNETYIPYQVESYSEMQWRRRQITLSLTYRFNMTKADRQKEQQRQRQNQDNGDEFIGG